MKMKKVERRRRLKNIEEERGTQKIIEIKRED